MRGMAHHFGGDSRSRSLLWLIQYDRAITQILDLYAICIERCHGTPTIETNTIPGEKIPVIKGDKHFCEIFI